MDPTDAHGSAARGVLVGIAGGSGSGKSTLARLLAQELAPAPVALVSFDAYYRDALRPEADGRVNFDHPAALEDELLESHLRSLRRGLRAEVPRYNFTTHRRLPEPASVGPAAFVIIDGILLFAFPRLCALLDGRVFVETPEAVRYARRLDRDVRERGRSEASVAAQFAATVQPMHERFVEPSRAAAHRVVSGAASFEPLLPGLLEWIRGLPAPESLEA